MTLSAQRRKIHDEICDCDRPDNEINFNPVCSSCLKPAGANVFAHEGEEVYCDNCFGDFLRTLFRGT
jgi:hypothetical protein